MSTIGTEYAAIVSTVGAATPATAYDGTKSFLHDPDLTEDADDLARRSVTRRFGLTPSFDREWLGDMDVERQKRGVRQTLDLRVGYTEPRRGMDQFMMVMLEDIDVLAAAIADPSNYAEHVSIRDIGTPGVEPPSEKDNVWIVRIPITITYDVE